VTVVWKRTVADTRFEVRRAGASIRLYRNGVFHSQYNPGAPLAANLWTLLVLPVFLRPPGGLRRVLVLGVGGGTVIHLLRHCLDAPRITGVELCATHLDVARRFFGVSGRHAELVNADAVAWLDGYRGPGFDLIIDDLYGECDGHPCRAVPVDAGWLGRLCRHLANDGLLVMNLLGHRAVRDALHQLQAGEPGRFTRAFGLQLPAYENTIGAFVPHKTEARDLRRRLASAPDTAIRRLARMPYRIRRIR
jgi:spermidine synthase